MAWTVSTLDRRVEINRSVGVIDYRSARDAQGINVAARQVPPRYRPSKTAAPNFTTGFPVDCLYRFIFRHRNQVASPVKRLGINMAREPCMERGIDVQSARAVKRDAGNDEVAAAPGIIVIGGHNLFRRACIPSGLQSRSDSQQHQERKLKSGHLAFSLAEQIRTDKRSRGSGFAKFSRQSIRALGRDCVSGIDTAPVSGNKVNMPVQSGWMIRNWRARS